MSTDFLQPGDDTQHAQHFGPRRRHAAQFVGWVVTVQKYTVFFCFVLGRIVMKHSHVSGSQLEEEQDVAEGASNDGEYHLVGITAVMVIFLCCFFLVVWDTAWGEVCNSVALGVAREESNELLVVGGGACGVVLTVG
jgi:hypothetical protein